MPSKNPTVPARPLPPLVVSALGVYALVRRRAGDRTLHLIPGREDLAPGREIMSSGEIRRLLALGAFTPARGLIEAVEIFGRRRAAVAA